MANIISLIAEKNFFTFFMLTVVIGGGIAYASGRAIALTWRPRWQLLAYMLLLGCVLRFFHWSLFEGSLLSGWFYIVDTLAIIAMAFIGYQMTRTWQITTRYFWLFKKTSPVSWVGKE